MDFLDIRLEFKWVLHLALENIEAKTQMPYRLNVPMAFGVLLFIHALGSLNREVIQKMLKIVLNATDYSPARVTV